MKAISTQAETPPALVNRTAAYFAKTVESAPLPTTDTGRYEFFTAAIMKTVAKLTAMLDSDDPKQVMYAADKLLGLERTRIRHARNVVGCQQVATATLAAEVAPVDDADEFDGIVPTKSTFKYAANDVEALACHVAELKAAFNKRAESKPRKFKPIGDEEAEAIVRRHLRIEKRRANRVAKDDFVRWAMYNLDQRLGYKE
jgi:hypothetical protein